MCLCLIYVGVNGTNCTYGLTSKQNKAHIYVGTVIGAITINSNLPRCGRLCPPSTLQSLLLHDKPRGASPGREDGISTNNLVLFYGVE